MTIGAARARFAKVLVNDVHALSRPAQTNGTIDQAILQFRALLMLPHLVHGRLSHIDVGQSGPVRRREPFVSGVQGGQHDPSPLWAGRDSLASAVSAQRSLGRSGLAPRPIASARGAEGGPPGGPTSLPKPAGVETQRDLEGLGAPSRITSSPRRFRFALKYCINGISVRALMRGSSATSETGLVDAAARSVDVIRIERCRPSGSVMAT